MKKKRAKKKEKKKEENIQGILDQVVNGSEPQKSKLFCLFLFILWFTIPVNNYGQLT